MKVLSGIILVIERHQVVSLAYFFSGSCLLHKN